MKVKLYLFATAVMLTAVFSGCKDDPIPPTVVTKPASGIAEGTATLNAEITNQGSDAVTSCGFYYNTSADMSYPEVVDANLDGSRFSSVISSLEPGKTYYYMAYAKSSAGMAEGEVLSFVTQAVKPTVETRPVSEVTTSGATLNAAIPSNGGSEITACGFYYSTSENMSNKATAEFTGTPDSLFSVAVSGLQSFTTYYYKAYATNALGSVEGEVMQFTTVIPPSVTTNAATDIYSASATLNGNVTNHGGTTGTIRGFVYGTSTDNLNDSIISGTGAGTYSQPITGLTLSTTYYFKAFASNNAGTVYGEVMQFTTSSNSTPTLQTVSATNITTMGATLNGNVTSDGGATVTDRGFVYGTNANDLSHTVQSGSGTGSFTKTLAGLAASTTYYYKAYATNAEGTSYGEVKQFTTSAGIGTLNGHDWVDLGLPSGLRWATCNVGAATPQASGDHYAWGETTPKLLSEWSPDNYTYTDNPSVLPPSADAATANWGSGWIMPTKAEFEELINNCTITSSSSGSGFVVTGPNGKSITFPSIPINCKTRGCSAAVYWSSSLCLDDTDHAWIFTGRSTLYSSIRYDLYAIRAVCN